MLYELAREIVTRILRDKVLVGLILILILGSFWSGLQMRNDPTGDQAGGDKTTSETPQVNPQQPQGLDPTLACDFVKWWFTSVLDNNSADSQGARAKAFGYMSEQAQNSFKTSFWSPEVADGIAAGKITATFHPASVQAVAINPDGSIVVSVNGTFIYQSGAHPASQQVQTDYLVRKEQTGLRIANIYNRVAPITSSSTY